MRRYAVKECFLTVQGEGAHAGRAAVFVRFAGCNVWSGREADRGRDAAKGLCAVWCDTDFVGTDGAHGGALTAVMVAHTVRSIWGNHDSNPLVVCTGGEPSLQLDDELVGALHRQGCEVHVETNGSRQLPLDVDWVTLSPKPPMPVVTQRYDELKVVYPSVGDPELYAHLVPPAAPRYVQPCDDLARLANQRACVAYVLAHPRWRLGVQLHKVVGLP